MVSYIHGEDEGGRRGESTLKDYSVTLQSSYDTRRKLGRFTTHFKSKE